MVTFKTISRILVKLFIAVFFIQLGWRCFFIEQYVITILCVIALVVIILLKPSER